MNNAMRLVKDRFNVQRRLRPWGVTHFGGMEAGKLHPLAFCRFRPDEGGTINTSLNLNLAPVSGYMRSKAYVDVKQIFVPYQAIEKLELDEQEDAGVTEMTRRRLMAGEGVGLEDEGVITKAGYVHPRSVGGDKRVQKSIRLAYIAAVNHLRKVAFYKATLLTKADTAIVPAVLAANVLERFNGVVEPERLVDGAVNLTGDLPVKGIAKRNATFNNGPLTGNLETGGEDADYDSSAYVGMADGNDRYFVIEEDPDNAGSPNIRVNFEGASELTLRDMIKSKKLDQLVRDFAGMIKADPVHGEEKVARALYSLSVDFDDDCHVIYSDVFELSSQHRRPTDGASINDVSGHFELNTSFSTLVPVSELGGQVVTLVSVKPLEVVHKQPDPVQTEAWQVRNRIHDETELDEVLLTRADLESELDAQDEDQSTFWVGYNSLEHGYSSHGVNDQQVLGVEMKSTMWTYEVPTSVTPENVSYPDDLEMYPFHNWNGAHAEYTISQRAAISTSLALGPNPVERVQLFADDPSLVEEEV